jgi:hypothetical protein
MESQTEILPVKGNGDQRVYIRSYTNGNTLSGKFLQNRHQGYFSGMEGNPVAGKSDICAVG